MGGSILHTDPDEDTREGVLTGERSDFVIRSDEGGVDEGRSPETYEEDDGIGGEELELL